MIESDREIMMREVARGGAALGEAAEELRDDTEIVMKAVTS